MPFLILATWPHPRPPRCCRSTTPDEADLDVMITGYQWKWKYEYLDQDVSFFSSLSTPPNEFDNIDNPTGAEGRALPAGSG